jgi:alpha/beta superfamily hydrolase
MTENSLPPAPEEFPDAASTFALRGPVGRLEVSVDLPESGLRAGVAIVCHPHPEHGGTMHNKVVTILERSLRESGLATVRFNFRGVGAAIWLAGFSFGSYVALRNAARLGADALITVAPPVGRWDLEGFEMPACPWLLIQGEEDEVVDPDAVFAWAEKLKPHPSVVRMPETSHFFHRRLMDLRGAVKNGVRPWLPAKRNA